MIVLLVWNELVIVHSSTVEYDQDQKEPHNTFSVIVDYPV